MKKLVLYDERMDIVRPQTRGDCKEGVRPCPWISCQYHLYSEADPDFTQDIDLSKFEETCVLDVADFGSISLAEIADLMFVNREKIKQTEFSGLRKLRHNSIAKELNEGFKELNIKGDQMPSKSKK